MMRDAWVFNELLAFCHLVNAGTQALDDNGAQVVPAWGAASKAAAKRGSKELVTSFAGALRAHKSEHHLEGPRHMQKVSESLAIQGRMVANIFHRKNVGCTIARWCLVARRRLPAVSLLFRAWTRC